MRSLPVLSFTPLYFIQSTIYSDLYTMYYTQRRIRTIKSTLNRLLYVCSNITNRHNIFLYVTFRCFSIQCSQKYALRGYTKILKISQTEPRLPCYAAVCLEVLQFPMSTA